MTNYRKLARGLMILALAAFACVNVAFAVERAQLVQDADAALKSLYGNQPAAKSLGEKAAGVLVFPNIVRAGFIVGGSGGDGVLYKKGKPTAYYSSGSASVGLQAGIQQFGYAVFFMTDAELERFQKSKGWDIGAAPTVVLVDAGMAKDINTMTGKSNIFAFIFNQEGLMAGLALQGQKITRMK